MEDADDNNDGCGRPRWWRQMTIHQSMWEWRWHRLWLWWWQTEASSAGDKMMPPRLHLEGITYMSPFWNHIFAKKGRFIHVRSQISWYVCSMYLGTKGDFFSYACMYFLCSSPTVLCAALWQASFLHMYRTISNTPNFTTACVLLTICRHTIFPRKSEKKFWFHVR